MMKDKLLEWFRKDSRAAWALLGLGILGMILIAAGGSSPKTGTPAAEAVGWGDYQESLEQRLEALIGEIQGVGKVSVMVTLETAEETVYALDTKENEESLEQEHVVLSGDEPLIETIWYPQVQGVAVVCQGAEEVSVRSQITQIISVLTGVTTNRISIAKMCE